MAQIELDGTTKVYGAGVVAVENVSLTVHDGAQDTSA